MLDTMLDWDDVRVFLAIARHGSLTAAARALHVTQPTMGRRLEALEERIGERLFDRTAAGATPTVFGATLLDGAERMEAAALQVERRIAGRGDGFDGLVHVTCLEWVGAHLLAPALSRFVAEHPGAQVELRAGDRLYSLARREAEIAVRSAAFEEASVVQRRLGTVAYGLYASPGYLALRGQPDFHAGCPGHLLVGFQQDVSHLPTVAWLTDQVAPRAPVAIRSSSTGVRVRAALAGTGMAMLPRVVGDQEAGLLRLVPPAPPPVRETWLGYHEDMRHVTRIRALADLIAEEFRRRAVALDPRDGG